MNDQPGLFPSWRTFLAFMGLGLVAGAVTTLAILKLVELI